MRYGTTTRLTRHDVIEQARAMFGPDSQLGMPEATTQDHAMTFCDQTGFISISCEPRDDGLEVTVLSREYDQWAEAFIRRIA